LLASTSVKLPIGSTVDSLTTKRLLHPQMGQKSKFELEKKKEPAPLKVNAMG